MGSMGSEGNRLHGNAVGYLFGSVLYGALKFPSWKGSRSIMWGLLGLTYTKVDVERASLWEYAEAGVLGVGMSERSSGEWAFQGGKELGMWYWVVYWCAIKGKVKYISLLMCISKDDRVHSWWPCQCIMAVNFVGWRCAPSDVPLWQVFPWSNPMT
jgi:hypothetical protein